VDARLSTNVVLLSATTTSGPTNTANILNGTLLALRSGVTNIGAGVSNAHPDFAVSNYGGKVYWNGVQPNMGLRFDSVPQSRFYVGDSYISVAPGNIDVRPYSSYLMLGPSISNAATWIDFLPGGATRARFTSGGLLGLWMTTPWATLHISNAITSTTNIFRIDATNCMYAFTVEPNGVATVRVPTNGAVASMSSPIGLFGCLSMTTTNTVDCANSSYTNIATAGAYTEILTNGFFGTVSAGSLTNLVAGYYKVACNVSFLAGAAKETELEIFVNETGQEKLAAFDTCPNPAKAHTLHVGGIVYLPAGSGVTARLKNVTDTTDIAVWRANLSIGTP
jgi:hypothetical protein